MGRDSGPTVLLKIEGYFQILGPCRYYFRNTFRYKFSFFVFHFLFFE